MTMTPKPPPHLSAAARRLFEQLCLDYDLSDAAAQCLLISACEAKDRADQARARIKKDGAYTKDKSGKLRVHPAVAVEQQSRNQLLSAFRSLRLSPK